MDKNKIRLILLIIILPASLFGQSGYLDNNPVWGMHSGCANINCSAPTCLMFDEFNYYLKGDTIFNNHYYKKLFKKGSGYYLWQGSNPPSCCQGTYLYDDTTHAVTYIRDTLNKFFLVNPITNLEELLYDFNLSVGDTLPLTYNVWDSGVVVSTIDSIAISNSFRKVFNLTGSGIPNISIIEGVGATSGLLEPITAHFDCGWSMTCFSENDTAYYPALGPTCNLDLDVEGINNNNLTLDLFPNPCNNILNVHSLNERNNLYSLIIYNSFGQNLITQKNIRLVSNQIDVSNISSGIYFLELISEKERMMKRFIKSDIN